MRSGQILFHSALFIVAMLLCAPFGMVAAARRDDGGNRKKVARALKALDRTLDSCSIYDRAKLERIDSLKKELIGAEESRLPSCYGKLHDIYYSFQSDSAMFYTCKEYEAAIRTGNERHMINSLLNIAQLNNITGNYFDTKTILDSLDRESLSPAHFARMCSVYNILHEYALALSIGPEQADYHRKKAMEYKDSLLAIENNVFVHTHKLMVLGRMDEAMDIVKHYSDSLPMNSPKKSMAAFLVSIIYRDMGEEDKEIIYLAQSVSSDIITAKKEHTAMIRLASILFEKGDLKRAYRYINKALDDATLCKANLKMESISKLMPAISDAHDRMVRRNYLLLTLALALICFVSFRLVQSLAMQKKQKRELASINRQLGEASNIKNTYITRLILECNRRIDRLDQYRKDLNRKAQSGDKDVLLRELRSHSVIEKEWKSFYEMFDSTFLSIFPDFVQEVNRLLSEGNGIVPKEQGTLTPELRIYALIRLGIDSSDKIATLLRYSKTTIYTYRSKTRQKAIRPEFFEDEIRKISSI